MSTLGNQGFDTLDEIIKMSCFEDGDENYKTYTQRYHLAVRFMREEAGQKLRVGTNIRKRRIPVDPETRRVDFPKDYVQYLTVGFSNNGNVMTFAYNPAMDISAINACGVHTPVNGGNVKGLPYNENDPHAINFNDYRLHYWTGGAWIGHGGGYVTEGDYQIDLENRQFVFSSNTKIDEIVLEYISDNYDPDGTNLVHVAVIKPCMLYIESNYLKALAKGNMQSNYYSMHQVAHKRYTFSLIEARRMLQSSTVKEVIQAFRRSAGGALKY
jgi:hypothetical protein